MQVLSDDELRGAFKQVQGEVPGSPVFAMKLAPPSAPPGGPAHL